MADLTDQIRIGADASGVEAGVSKAKRSLRDLADAARTTGDGVAASGAKAGRSLAAMGDGGEAAARKIQRDTSAMRGSLQRYLASLEAGSKDSRRYWETMADFKGIDRNALAPLLKQLDAYNAKTKEAAESTASWTGGLSRIGAGVAGVAAITATVGVAAKAMFDASVSAERLRTMLDFSTGGNSAKEIEYLRGITYRLGLEFTSTAKAYSQFSAAAKGTALEGDKARAVFESVAKASSVMGLSAADTSGVLLALQQMISKGTVQAEELRGQLGERLPGAFQIAAKAMGVTTGELGKMLEQGQVIADDFLPKFAAALDKNLGGAAEKAANRLDASVNRLSTAWDRLKQNSGDSGVSSFMAGQYEILADGFNGVSEAMERARGSGSGFIGQMAAGAVAAAKFANPLQAVSYSAIETGNALKQAEAEFAALQKRGDVLGGNIYYKAEMANLAALIKELKAAQAEKQKLATGAAPNMNEGVIASGRAREQFMLQREKDLEAANAFRLKQAGVPDGYLKDMAELIRLNQAGVLVGKEYTEALKKQQDELLKKTGVTKGAAAAANQEQNAYENLVASIRTKIAANEAEISGAGRLSESDKLRIKLQEELSAGAKTLTAAHKARAMALLDILAAQEKEEVRIKGLVATYKQEAEIAEELARSYVERSKAREAGRAAVSSYANGIDEANNALQFELSLMGLGERARNVALEQYRIELELKKQIAAIDANTGFDEAQRIEERAKARAAAAIATANASSRAFLEEWKQSVSTYEDVFRRGFADMLNNGKDGWKSFTRSLATTFKTTVADQLYKAFAQPFVVNIVGNLLGLTGALGLGGATGAAAAGSSALGTVGNIASGARFLGGLGAFGGGLSGGFGGLLGSLGLSASGTTLGGALSAGSIALGSGNILGGLGTFVGALGPIALGIGALTSLLGSFKGETRTGGQFGVAFDGQVANNRRGQTYTMVGQQYDRDFTNGQNIALTNGQAYRLEGDPVAQEQAIRDAVSGTATGINAFLEALGSAARLTGFSAGLETSGKGRGGVFAGGTLTGGVQFGESGQGDNYAGTLYEKFSTNSPDFKQALADFTLDLKQSTIQALQSVTDIPETVKKLLKDVDAEGLSEEAANALLESINAQIVGVQNLTQAFDAMGMEDLAKLSFDAAAGLAEVSGGFDKLLTNLNTYYENFFSPEEQRANIERQLREQFAALDLSLPDINAEDARAQYRRLVEAAEKDLSDEGRKTYATLLQLAGAFASITTEAENAASTIAKQQADARDAAYRALERAVAKEREVLQSRIDVARESVDTLGNLFDLLKSNVRELYGEVDSTRALQAQQGRDFISQALGTARTTGYLPEADAIAEAIGAARAGLDSKQFRSTAEADFQRLVLAGQLGELEGLTGKQLSTADKTLRELEDQSDQLDKTLAYWRDQLDIANGTYKATLSVADAIKELQSLMFPDVGVNKPDKIGSSSGGGAVFGGGASGGISTPQSKYKRPVSLGTGGVGYVGVSAEEEKRLDEYNAGYRAFDGTGDAAGLAAYITANKLTPEDMSALSGLYANDWDKWYRENGIPQFAVGTNYVPRDMLARIHEGEAIVPKAYNPAANPGMSGNTARMESLLAEIKDKLDELRQVNEEGNGSMGQLAEQFDRVTAGGNAMGAEILNQPTVEVAA